MGILSDQRTLHGARVSALKGAEGVPIDHELEIDVVVGQIHEIGWKVDGTADLYSKKYAK